jgi:hypothetical protein
MYVLNFKYLHIYLGADTIVAHGAIGVSPGKAIMDTSYVMVDGMVEVDNANAKACQVCIFFSILFYIYAVMAGLFGEHFFDTPRLQFIM